MCSRPLLWLVFSVTVCAQQGQQPSRPGWPCVPGRAVDPSYLEISESTGGQVFLLQKGEVEHSAVVMSASHTHPASIARAIGQLSGSREIRFPVDSTVRSFLVLASLQCRKEVAVLRPNGSEMTSANAAHSVDLQAGRILRVDAPESGEWKVRLSGTGLYVVSVLADSPVRVSATFHDGAVTPAVTGEVSDAEFTFVDPAGGTSDGKGRFRVLMTGMDALGNRVQRVHPVLFSR